jgi:hypothetical protein
MHAGEWPLQPLTLFLSNLTPSKTLVTLLPDAINICTVPLVAVLLLKVLSDMYTAGRVPTGSDWYPSYSRADPLTAEHSDTLLACTTKTAVRLELPVANRYIAPPMLAEDPLKLDESACTTLSWA